jgi:hypothetical protein
MAGAVVTTTTTAVEPVTTTILAATTAPVPPGSGRPPAAASPACPPRPPRAAPWPTRPAYVVDLVIDAAARTVTGTSSVRFTPDRAADRVVLRLWPNSPAVHGRGGAMAIRQATIDGAPVTVGVSSSDPTLGEVAMPLQANRTVTIASAWTITLAADAPERWSAAAGAVRLASFVPLLPWEPGVGWATDRATLVHGEASTAPVADWDVAVDAKGLEVVATGVRSADGRWKASGVRDFGLTAGTFRQAEGTAAAGPGGAPVPVLVVADKAVAEAPGPYAAKAVKALESHARRFGPYPYPVYTLALSGALKGGIENPMFVMQGPGSIDRTTSHEIGHEWFYSLVGNDQGRDPWLDEGLASWAEAGYEGTLASMRATTIPADARGHAGESTRFYDDKTFSYYRGVYVQPVQALAALGPAAVVDCVLAAWVDEQAHAIATPESLRAALTRTFPNARQVLAPYGL